MKFAHMGDCHLGSWTAPEMRELNFKSFQYAIDKCIREKVEFILITGDLFDTAYPTIEVLKDSFAEFRKVRDAFIPVFLIAGSHDYSVSGKTFLDVLEKGGFAKNVALCEERKGMIVLHPTIYKEVALYGYPGKKSGLEVQEIERIKLDDAPGFYKILLLHTALRDAVGNLPIDAVDHTRLPPVDFLALSHLHIRYSKPKRAYSGPTFPANLNELEELQGGCFNIIEGDIIRREDIILKKVVVLTVEISQAASAEEKILAAAEKESLHDKIVILKLRGVLEQGKIGDIDFLKLESLLKKSGAFTVLKTTSRLSVFDSELSTQEEIPAAVLEQEIIRQFIESNPSKYNSLIPQLLLSLHMEKTEDEKATSYQERVISESRKIILP